MRLKLPATEPTWIEIEIGEQRARFLCAPYTAELEYMTLWEAQEALAALAKDASKSAAERSALAHMRAMKALARKVVSAWEGLEDEATGDPLPFSPDMLDRVFSVRAVVRAFDRAYGASTGVVAQEKNASRPAAAGMPAAGPITAAAASPPSDNAAPNADI